MNQGDLDRLLRGPTPPAPGSHLAGRILAAALAEPALPWWAELWPFGAPSRSPLRPLAGMAAAVLIGALCGTALTRATATAAVEEVAAVVESLPGEIRVEEAVVVAFFPEAAFLGEGPR